MEFLKTLNFTEKCKYYYCNDGNVFHLEYINKWYLYNYNELKLSIIYNITDFINDNKNIFIESKNILDENDKYIDEIEQLIGKCTFCTRFIIGWNICNSKIKLKITIDRFKCITNKTIQIQYTSNKTYNNETISNTELLNFINDNIESILFKDLDNNNKDLDNNHELDNNKDLDNNHELDNNDLDNNHELDNKELDNKKAIDKIKKKLFIKLSKAKKIYYQSCLPYDEDKIKLEKLYGINLDL